MNTAKENYPKRGEFKPLLQNALKSEGKWGSIIEYVRNHSNIYDLQVRANYLNVYYNGGNILRINPDSLDVDEFYFHTEIDADHQNTRKTVIQKNAKTGDSTAIDIIDNLRQKRDDYLKSIKKGHSSSKEVEKYFNRMMTQMKEWEKVLYDKLIKDKEKEEYKDINCEEKKFYHKEKFIQQKITLANRDFENSDLVVLDVEFAVSDKAPYKSEDCTHPRFDMIAVDKEGRIHVLELKYGLRATGIDYQGKSASDIKGHTDKFLKTVGGREYEKFIEDIEKIVSAKKSLGLSYLNEIKVSKKKPVFDIVYAEPSEGTLQEVKNYIKDKVNTDGKKVTNIWFINTSTKNYKLKL